MFNRFSTSSSSQVAASSLLALVMVPLCWCFFALWSSAFSETYYVLAPLGEWDRWEAFLVGFCGVIGWGGDR